MSVKILVATGSSTVLDRLSTVVEEVADLELVGKATSSNALTPMLRRRSVDVLVIDDAIGPMVALDVVRDVVTRFPFVAVIVVSPDSGMESLRAAVDAGARGVVSLTMSFEDIAARLRVASSWAASIRAVVDNDNAKPVETRTGTLVALNGAKGGVGVSTLAARLAVDAANTGQSVCLVDLDLQKGDIGHLLDISHHRDITDLVGVVDDTGTALENALYLHPSGLRVLLAPADGERGEDIDGATARAILSRMRALFDIVIVDCGSSVTEASAVAVAMAERAIVISTPDVVSLRAARRLTQLWGRLDVRAAADCSVLLNRVSNRNQVQPRTAERICGLPQLTAVVPAAFRKLEPGVNTTMATTVEDRQLRSAFGKVARELGLGGATPALGSRRGRDTKAEGGWFRRGGKRRDRGGDAGLASLEYLVVLPLLLVVVALGVQVALTGYTYVLAGEAANRASRSLAVGASPDQAVEAAEAVLPGSWRAQDVDVDVPLVVNPDTGLGRVNADAKVSVALPVPLLGIGVAFPWTARASSAWGME